MRKAVLVLIALGLAGSAALPAAPEEAAAAPDRGPAALLGFAPGRVAGELAREKSFDATLRPEDLREWMHRLAARPHHLGSPGDKANVEFLADLFRSWGYEVAVEEFQVLFPTPAERHLEMVAPDPFTATLAEDPIPEDSTSGQTAEQLPTYNAYSVDGDVTGELVYVNYGVPEDYEELARHGVSVAGKIAIARYGGSWRGIKPKVAAEHGAVACILYSDPSGDGYAAGDVYPGGGYRPEQGVQRGSVADMPLYPGDPLTPGVGAVAGAKRLPIEEAKTLTRIPVLPISYRDALPLLSAMGGEVVPEGWRGALPITYHLGPGPATVHLELAFHWDLVPARDVIARLPGAELPEEWILRGNHQDAWVNGATDPISGLVTLLAEAQGVSRLVAAGWRPRRTLVFAAWDGEEPGLLGSTEWAETHAAELAEKAAVYVNTDSYGRGFIGAGGSHTLETLVNQVARDVTDPEKGISVLERGRAALEIHGAPAEQAAAKSGGPLPIDALGSGSDYTPFLQHLGVASLNLEAGGEGDYGQYHSIYDSYDHFERFMDPGFTYGIALSRFGGRLVLRLADADVLPFDPAPFAATAARYVDELVKLTDKMREDTAEENRRIDEGLYAAVSDPEKTFVAPEPKAPVPYLNLAPLENAIAELKRQVEAYGEACKARDEGGQALTAAERQRLDRLWIDSERALTRPEGLPDRPWYRHFVYAPGFYTGYGVKTLPAVREAIELRRWDEVPAAVEATAGVLTAFAAKVAAAKAILAGK
jgi:N-acetylated-alpha-linked acidic dipeptidase